MNTAITAKNSIAFITIPIMALLVLPMGLLPIMTPISGIWLAILGEWSAIAIGVGYAIAGTSLLSIAMMPGLLFLGALLRAEERIGLAGWFGIAISGLWTYSVLIISCLLVLNFMLERSLEHGTLIPYAVWGLIVASGPWALFAEREDKTHGNSDSKIVTLCAGVGSILAIIGFMNGARGGSDLALWFVPGVMFILLNHFVAASDR